MAVKKQGNIKKVDVNEIGNKKVYVKKVILENFLSFQKDEVDFGDSKFIIIVGPNWSGKTTIFQAIKFALGSNERGDRYPKWSNFIRNGQKHAMVELHIQSDKELIKIRRIVIRGQSPYFSIKRGNDKNFRRTHAAEIQKLVSELNYNPDNHFAFVSQGKIGAIKDLKPKELCLFLEEGIGLRSLREEILQQKNNILNLNNELNSLISKKNVLNISLELLRPKFERLEQKKKLLEVKKGYNDELLWANRKKLRVEIKNLERDFLRIRVVIDEIKQKKEKNEHEIKKFKEKISKIELIVNYYNEKLGQNNNKRKDLIKKIKSWQKTKIDIKLELDKLSEKISKEEKILINFKTQKKSLDNELKIIKKEKSNIQQNFDKLLKEQTILAKKIEHNEKFLKEYDELISNKNEREKKIHDIESSINEINDIINQLFQSFKDIDHKLEKNKWFLENPTHNLRKQLDIELRKVNSKQYLIKSDIEELKLEKSKKLRKLKPLQASLRERRVILPSNINILKEEIKKRDLKVKGPIIEYLKYEDTLSYAIESVLGERLLYSFIAADWDTLELLNRLKNKYRSYCNIYVPKNIKVSYLPKISSPGVIGYLTELIKVVNNDLDVKKVLFSIVKNCLVVKDYRSGKEMHRKYNFKGKCVTLKGEQIISHKYVYETPFLKHLKGLLSVGTQKEQSKLLESEIESINDRILESEIEASKLDKTQNELFRKKEAFDDLLYSFNEKERLTRKKNRFYEQRANLEKNKANLLSEIKELDIKTKNLKFQKDPEFFKWNERIKEIPRELNEINDDKKKWDQKLNENQEIIKEVVEKINFHNNSLSLLKKEHKTKLDYLKKTDIDTFKVFHKLEVVENRISKFKDKIVKLNNEKNDIEEEKNILDQKNTTINLNLEQENIKFNYAKQQLESKKNDLERINSQIKPLISKEKIKIRPFEEINKDILKIDKELLKYLDVDDSILVERDQLMGGLKEIDKNQKDLDKDIKAAMKTENKMEDKYYEKFQGVLETLESKINNKFKSSQIKSYCSLKLIGNFEELGVDIKAATSRDQLKACTALSGGQVSMISICLILSLQEIKTSPLCMFDEAGMFLDDKNSEVVYQMIKSTLEANPIQMLFYLPTSSNALYLLADKLIGVARVGKSEVSTIFKPKILKKKD